MLSKVNFDEAFARFDDHWNPRIVADLNGQHVKVAKILGEFEWHHHEHEDELFLIHRGEMEMQWKEGEATKSVLLKAGEFFVVPKTVEHRPIAKQEVQLILFEPAETVNTGNISSDRTRTDLERLG